MGCPGLSHSLQQIWGADPVKPLPLLSLRLPHSDPCSLTGTWVIGVSCLKARSPQGPSQEFLPKGARKTRRRTANKPHIALCFFIFWSSHAIRRILVPCCRRSVAKSRLTLCDPMDSSQPGSSAHWVSQVRILEWVAVSVSRGSSQLRKGNHATCTGSVES